MKKIEFYDILEIHNSKPDPLVLLLEPYYTPVAIPPDVTALIKHGMWPDQTDPRRTMTVELDHSGIIRVHLPTLSNPDDEWPMIVNKETSQVLPETTIDDE